ncbi:hypothetical protein Pcinc_037753 [Petrolisthes cinctipes]|uniref:Cationic amino acid transporter C-terminal domain-containing protein n=1 Tax=Petrolisthes cinctipes TaxID=88211 RepID=A0AAE1BSW4_PETCI|nr:hypothetical protein Pcinc_037753 [Petrolisthes cinctipes]
MPSFVDRLARRKYVEFDSSPLPRVLGLVDLTALGIGSTIGVGIYVLAGKVALDTAGPAVTICFLIAAIASVFAGVCYAEFGARVPKAGSAYVYTYICVGEFVAFIIGWNLILEYVIGTASVASAYSGYIDKLANYTISNTLMDVMPLKSDFLGDYPDFLAFSLSLVLSIGLAFGVKESSRLNTIFTSINMVVILFVIISAGTQADGSNWRIPESKLNETCTSSENDWGTGGFAPFGFEGIMAGAATCFFGFVGFDVIATTGEEAKNPSRTIPLSIFLSLGFIFFSYFGIAAVITLVIPYCNQDDDAPLVALYDTEGLDWPVAKWFVTIGAFFGFSASLFGAMFPLPRVIYAMASDGLIFRWLGKISKRFKTPAIASFLSGIFAGVMSLVFDVDALIDMMSIGTLMAYTIVAVCVMLLRYTNTEMVKGYSEYTLLSSTFADDEDKELPDSNNSSKAVGMQHTVSDYARQLFNTHKLKDTSDLTYSLVAYATVVFCMLVTLVALLLVTLSEQLSNGDVGAITAIVITGVLTLVNLIIIARQPQSKKKLSFKVPFVPWIPALSAFINMYLMCNLSRDTWFRFLVWMAVGFLMYFGYGVWHSTGAQSLTPGQGRDNLGFVRDGKNNLVIPTIEIHPATPTNSEPNTPRTDQKVQKTMVPSPLAQTPSTEPQNTVESKENDDKGSNVGEVMNVSDTQEVAAVSVTEKKEIQAKSSLDTSDIDEIDGKDTSKTTSLPDIDKSVLIAGAIIADSAVQKSISDNTLKKEEEKADVIIHGINEGEEEVTVELRIKGDASRENDQDGYQDPKYASLEEIKTSLTKEGMVKDEENKDDKHIGVEAIVSTAILTNELGENSTKSTESDQEPVYATVNKDKKKKSGKPTEAEFENNESSEDINNTGIHISQSVPVLPAKITQRPKSDSEMYRSVPTTPVTRRHPVKVLRRMSSFDDIPPSSPDSPFARSIGNKFTIIPVQEPRVVNGMKESFGGSGFDIDNDSSAPTTPHSGMMISTSSDSPSQLMSQLLSKLPGDEEQDLAENQGSPNLSKPLFSLGSTESLTNISSADKAVLVSDEAGSRDLKRNSSRESRLEVMDTIRERGESKIIHNDDDFLPPIIAPPLTDYSSIEKDSNDHQPPASQKQQVEEKNSNENKEMPSTTTTAKTSSKRSEEDTGGVDNRKNAEDGKGVVSSNPMEVGVAKTTDNGQAHDITSTTVQEEKITSESIKNLQSLFQN